MSFFCYIFFSPQYSKYYIGQSNDLELRLLFHNKLSDNSFTSKYRPWQVYTALEFKNRTNALKVEKYLKKKNRVFIARLKTDSDLRKYILDRFDT